MIYGARTSVILCVCCTILSTLVSLVIGVLSAVIGGWFDLIVQRIVDAFGAFPRASASAVMSLMGNGIPQMIVALAVPVGHRRLPPWYALRRWPSRILVTAITLTCWAAACSGNPSSMWCPTSCRSSSSPRPALWAAWL